MKIQQLLHDENDDDDDDDDGDNHVDRNGGNKITFRTFFVAFYRRTKPIYSHDRLLFRDNDNFASRPYINFGLW